eukprot:4835372-Amphidinium_carterae.1
MLRTKGGVLEVDGVSLRVECALAIGLTQGCSCERQAQLFVLKRVLEAERHQDGLRVTKVTHLVHIRTRPGRPLLIQTHLNKTNAAKLKDALKQNNANSVCFQRSGIRSRW